MIFEKYTDRIANASAEIRFLRWLAGGLAALALLLVMTTLRLIGSERVVLLPPEVNRTMWVSGSQASKEYLEEMGFWYAGLALNITPATSEYQNSLFLKFAAPSEYGRLQAEMGARAEFLRKNNVSTQFAVRSISVDAPNNRVALHGTLYTWTSDKKAGERSAVYMVGFKLINGRLYVSDFRETSDQDPFGGAAAGRT